MCTDNFCFYLQNRLIQTSQTGGQRYSDTSPISILWLDHYIPLMGIFSALRGDVRRGKGKLGNVARGGTIAPKKKCFVTQT